MKKYLFIISVFILSCERKEVKNNSGEDVKFAKVLATNFYKELSDLDTLKIYNYLDNSIPKNELHKLIEKNNTEYGSIKKVDIKNIITNDIILNNRSEIKYEIHVLVLYDKVKCNETVSFIKRNNESAKLEGYLTQEIIE